MGKPSHKVSMPAWNEAEAGETSIFPRVQPLQVVQPKLQNASSAAPWRAVRTLKRKVQKNRVPEISQMSSVECGLACLAMVLSYHGRQTTLTELRAQSGIGRDALSALS